MSNIHEIRIEELAYFRRKLSLSGALGERNDRGMHVRNDHHKLAIGKMTEDEFYSKHQHIIRGSI